MQQRTRKRIHFEIKNHNQPTNQPTNQNQGSDQPYLNQENRFIPLKVELTDKRGGHATLYAWRAKTKPEILENLQRKFSSVTSVVSVPDYCSQ